MKTLFGISSFCRVTYTVVSAAFLMVGCSALNEPQIEPFDKDGIIKQSYVDNFYSGEEPSNIRFYVESSGSMNGLFRKGQSTAFKYDVSAILFDPEVKDKVNGISLFGNNAEILNEYTTTEEFRKRMNAGEFVSQASTVVPGMLRRIVDDLNNSVCDVAVFISDMKYSPIGSGYNVNMDQYSLEIQDIFSSLPGKSVSLISCESDFIAVDGTVLSNVFPYYFTIIGEPEKVAWLRNEFMATLSQSNRVQGCIDFAVNYGCPNYTALPSTSIGIVRNSHEFMIDTLVNSHSSSFTTYDDAMQPAEVILAVNYRHIPLDVISSLSETDFRVSSYWGLTKASITIMPDTYKPTADAVLLQNVNPNVFLKLTVTGLGNNKEDVLKVQLQNRFDKGTFIEKYYGAVKEDELDKTLSIDGFIEGLKRAYPSEENFQNAPMVLFITKKN